MSGKASFKTYDILELSKKLVVACYTLTGNLPADEKTNLTLYIRHAALVVHMNSIQGSFLKKKKARKKIIREAKNSLVIIDAAVDVLIEVGLAKSEDTNAVIELSSNCYQLLDRLKKDK